MDNTVRPTFIRRKLRGQKTQTNKLTHRTKPRDTTISYVSPSRRRAKYKSIKSNKHSIKPERMTKWKNNK